MPYVVHVVYCIRRRPCVTVYSSNISAASAGAGRHPIAYVAKASHGMYPSMGVWARFCCCANDSIAVDAHQSVTWIPSVLLTADAVSDDVVLQYCGQWGIDGVSNIPDKGAFAVGEPATSNTWWRRMFCCGCDAICCLRTAVF